MTTGLELSMAFIEEILMPALRRNLGDEIERLAVAVIGTGSEVLGLDDELSRDHHWGPRASILYLRNETDELAPKLISLLSKKIPDSYQGFKVTLDQETWLGLSCCAVEEFFERFLGTDRLPQKDLDWLRFCEVDLFHVTAGKVIFDGPGELSRRREFLAYYPDTVWKKRLADWCFYIAARDGPYNFNRACQRGDEVSASICLGRYFKGLMEVCFLLNRRYAPYAKWLNQTFRRLPRFVDRIAPGLERLAGLQKTDEQLKQMIDLNYLVADALAELGLAEPVERQEFKEGNAEDVLAEPVSQIYRILPGDLILPSFNRIEYWERLAREVLLPHILQSSGKTH